MIVIINLIILILVVLFLFMVMESFSLKDILRLLGIILFLFAVFNFPNKINGRQEVYKSIEVQYFISTTKVLDKENKVHEIQELGLQEFSDLLNHSSSGKPLYIVKEKTVSAKMFDNNLFNRYITNYKVKKTNTVEN